MAKPSKKPSVLASLQLWRVIMTDIFVAVFLIVGIIMIGGVFAVLAYYWTRDL